MMQVYPATLSHAMRLRQSAKNGDQTVFAEQALAKVNLACYSSVPRKTTQTLQSETKKSEGLTR
jgi:hypothetical protein